MTHSLSNLPIRVPLGHLVITRGALAVLDATDVDTAIDRHAAGDWGDVCAEDKLTNDEAARKGDRLLSSYRDRGDVVFWVITEWDRSVTTVLLPDEY